MTDPTRTDGPVVNHVGLCVTDLDRSCAFYIDVLGFEPDRELAVPDQAAGYLLSVEAPVGLTAVYLRRGPFTLELLHFDRPGNPAADDHPFNQPGLTHLSFAVADLDASVALVTERGGEVLTLIPGAAAIVLDPDGQRLELLPMSYRATLDP
jgi:catechol 2,3-dioxygenase-like lactoylglutathione lyase family enzyme